MYAVGEAPGTKCYTYADCMAELRAGNEIDYEGVTGPGTYSAGGVNAVTFGLSRRWLAARPAFLQEVRHESFALRRDAFVQIVYLGHGTLLRQCSDETTPEDPAPYSLSQREGAEVLP